MTISDFVWQGWKGGGDICKPPFLADIICQQPLNASSKNLRYNIRHQIDKYAIRQQMANYSIPQKMTNYTNPKPFPNYAIPQLIANYTMLKQMENYTIPQHVNVLLFFKIYFKIYNFTTHCKSYNSTIISIKQDFFLNLLKKKFPKELISNIRGILINMV